LFWIAHPSCRGNLFGCTVSLKYYSVASKNTEAVKIINK